MKTKKKIQLIDIPDSLIGVERYSIIGLSYLTLLIPILVIVTRFVIFPVKDYPPFHNLSFWEAYIIDGFSYFLTSFIIYIFLKKYKYKSAKYTAIIGWSICVTITDIVTPYIEGLSLISIIFAAGNGLLFNKIKDFTVSFIFTLLIFFIVSLNKLPFYSANIDYHKNSKSTIFIELVIFLFTNLVMYIYSKNTIKYETSLLAKTQELKINQNKLKSEIRKVEQLEKQRTKYFSNIAHELRTPLTVISGISENIKEYSNNKVLNEKIQLLSNNTNELKLLVSQILNLIKKDANILKPTLSRFQLPELMKNLILNLIPLANQKKIKISSSFYIEDSLELTTDKEMLHTVLKNILTNAIKYNNIEGSINIVATETIEEVTISIQDTGRGIDESNLPNIFDRYYQIYKDNHSPEGGLGLGLAICKEYISILNGTIDVNSKISIGSTFSITIPKVILSDVKTTMLLTDDPIKTDPIIINTLPGYTNENAIGTILVVEDNISLTSYYKTILQGSYSLLFAANGKEALDILQKNTLPDLIISDLMMPVMDGIEFLSILKNTPKYLNIPTIIVTAKLDLSDRIDALRIGIDSYLLKPFNENVLHANINSLLSFSDERIANQKELFKNPHYSINNRDRIWIEKFEKKIEAIYENVYVDIDLLAEEMSTSRANLYRKVTSIIGLTPKKYLQEVRLLKALNFLENEKYDSVKSVAYSCGYKSEKVFSRNFKARFGKYPSEYLR